MFSTLEKPPVSGNLDLNITHVLTPRGCLALSAVVSSLQAVLGTLSRVPPHSGPKAHSFRSGCLQDSHPNRLPASVGSLLSSGLRDVGAGGQLSLPLGTSHSQVQGWEVQGRGN